MKYYYITVSFGKKSIKCYVGYKDNKRVRPLCVMLQKISAYRKDFDEDKYMSLLIKNDEFLEKSN